MLNDTVGVNIIATTKIQDNYGGIQSFIFSIAPCKVITFNPFESFFVSVLCFFFDGSLSKLIDLLKLLR